LMNQKKDRPDWVAIRRFERLCTFLDNNRDCFSVKGFHGLAPQITVGPHKPLTSPRWKALSRAVEQLYRKFYQ
jgi:hypothetical protein